MPIAYVLNTNVLLHLIRGDQLRQHIKSIYDPTLAEPRPVISVVTAGELRSLALQFQWGKTKVDQALFYLSYFQRISIDQDPILDAYAALDAYSISIGRTLGKNDL